VYKFWAQVWKLKFVMFSGNRNFYLAGCITWPEIAPWWRSEKMEGVKDQLL
jgi:hypothetical protein